MTNNEADKKSDTKPDDTRRKPTLFVGVDLGTSRTAIAASNDQLKEVSTYVGRPKDEVSRKLFGDRLLFGDEALNNRMSVDLYRPLEEGVIKASSGEENENLMAVQNLIEHVVTLVNPNPDDVVYGVIGAPARASIESKKAIIEAASPALDAVMVVSEPFTVAYGLDRLADTLILDIGAGTMDLCRMHGTLPAEEDQVTINKAGDFVDEALYRLIKMKYPEAQFTINMIKKVKEKHGYVTGSRQKIEVDFTVEGRPRRFDIAQELKDACSVINPDVTDAVTKLIGSFDPEFQEKLRNNVLVCGGGSQLQGIQALIEESLVELGGGKVAIVDDPIFAGAKGALKIATEMPSAFWGSLE